MPVKPIPDGFHTVTPYLIVKGVPQVIEFLHKAFNATILHKTGMPGGTILHAEQRVGSERMWRMSRTRSCSDGQKR